MLEESQPELEDAPGISSFVKPQSATAPDLKGWRYFLAIELKPFASLASPWYWGSLIAVFSLFCVVYQLPFTKKIELDSTRDRPFLVDYYAVERFEDFVYRWVQPSSNVVLPGVGIPPRVKVTLEISARPPQYPQSEIRVEVNRTVLGTITPIKDTPPTTYNLEANIPDRNLLEYSGINLWLDMEGFLARGDRRPLGVVVSGINIEAAGLLETGRPVLPPLPEIAMLLVMVATVYLLARRGGFTRHSASAGLLFFALVLMAGLVLDRPTVGISAPVLLQTTLLAYPLAVTGWWFAFWVLQKRNYRWGERELRWLLVIFAFAFGVRAAGMNNPSFQVLDHGFRVNEVLEIKQDPSIIFSRYYNRNTFESVGNETGRSVTAGQWGMQVTIPYSPLFYMLDLPIAWLTENRLALLYWTNVFGAWLDVSVVFFLYLIARTAFGRYGHKSGLIAAALYAFFPLSWLMVSDGGFNSITAHWFMLAYLLAMTRWFEPDFKPVWKDYVLCGFLLTMTFLAHTATLLLSGAMVFFFTLILIFGYKGRWRMLGKRIGLQFASALVVSFALYYGFYLLSLITQTIPSMLGKIGSGQKVGTDALSSTVRSFLPSLWAHFYFVPFLIALGLISWLMPPLFRTKQDTTRKREVSEPAALLLESWLLSFLLFSLVAEFVNLLQKHMLFVIPLLALSCGLLLAMVMDYFKPAKFELEGKRRWSPLVSNGVQLAAIAFTLYIVVAGSIIWYQRVINYVLPAGTG